MAATAQRTPQKLRIAAVASMIAAQANDERRGEGEEEKKRHSADRAEGKREKQSQSETLCFVFSFYSHARFLLSTIN